MNNAATDKQINFILALTNERHPSSAYREMAKDMNCSASSAQRRATKQDASRTISRLQGRA